MSTIRLLKEEVRLSYNGICTVAKSFNCSSASCGHHQKMINSAFQGNESDDHKEQCDKLMKFELEFGLPTSNIEPVTRQDSFRDVSSPVSQEHSYTEKELSKLIEIMYTFFI